MIKSDVNIAVVISRYYPIFGGAENQARLLNYNLLKFEGIKIPFIITKKYKQEYSENEKIIDGIKIVRLGKIGISQITNYLFFLSVCIFLIRNRKKYQIIHCHSTAVLGFFVTLCGIVLNKKTLLKLSSNGELLKGLNNIDTKKKQSYLRLLLGYFLSTYSKIVALNQQGVSEIKYFTNKNLFLIPNGVDSSIFYPLNIYDRNHLRKKYSLSERDKVFLFVGRFVKSKGLDELINAFVHLIASKKHENIFLFLVGSSDLQNDQFTLNSNIEFDKFNIRVLEPMIPPSIYYQIADIFVFPSHREGMPNSVLEALNSGLVCILSDIEPHVEIRENLENKENIILHEVNNWNSLYCRMDESLIVEKEEVNLPDIYKIENVAAKYVEIYRNMKLKNNKV